MTLNEKQLAELTIALSKALVAVGETQRWPEAYTPVPELEMARQAINIALDSI